MLATYIELKHGVVLMFMALQAALNCIFDGAYPWWNGEVHHKACNFCFGLWGDKRHWEQPNRQCWLLLFSCIQLVGGRYRAAG
ncbi:MAG: hypothetical protein ACRC2N_12980 [Aeromonas sp.]